jgi:predicted DNA-binding WGR domain protein
VHGNFRSNKKQMERYLVFKDDKSDKFWKIKTSGNSFTVTYGKTGTNGQTQVKEFASEEKCLKEAEKLVSEKLKKGYLPFKGGVHKRKSKAQKPKEKLSQEQTLSYKQQWSAIENSKDKSKAVYNHLLFLCETPDCKKILRQMCDFVESVGIDDDDRLSIHFGGDSYFIGLAPYVGKYDKAVPESHRQVCNYHREITLEGGDTPIVFNGVNKKGQLYSNAFDPHDFDDIEVIEENSETVVAPIDYKQDYIIYHPTIRTARQEPALCFLSHEGDGLYPPYSKKLGLTGVLLRLFAQEILDVKLLEPEEAAQKKKLKGNNKPIQFKRSKKPIFTLKLVSQYKNENSGEDSFNGLIPDGRQLFCTTSRGLLHRFEIDDAFRIAHRSEKKLGPPLSQPVLALPYIYANVYKAVAIVDVSKNAPEVVSKMSLEWQLCHYQNSLLFGQSSEQVAILSCNNPFKPLLKSTISAEVQYDGNTLYLGTEEELLVYDISEPTDPTFILKLKSPIDYDSREFRLFDDVLVINHQWFIDVQDPQKPVSLGFTKISLDMHDTIRINDFLIVFSEFGEYFVIDASKRDQLAIVQRAKLMDQSGQQISCTVKYATLVDNHVITMTDSELLCFAQVRS